MSKAEERVVKFSFNNTGFERNAEKTLQTLERLEGKLQFKDAEKGFKNVEKAAQNVKMSGLIQAIGTVETKFSAMQIAGITAISNIVNKAVDSGERLVKSLSIDQVTEGYTKYEQKVNSVKTIMSATGKSIDQVNKSLKRLNWFTDETSYNYSDMADNIGKFTSAGVDLDDAVIAMQGIATWAGISGQNTQSAARAMYNISQAMGAGTMKLIDWKSIENANMATTEFKQTAIDTAVALGTLQKDANGLVTTLEKGTSVTAKDFTNSLSESWFTSDVMLATLRQYGEYAEQVYDEVERSGRSTIEVMKELGEANDSLGKRAFEASQQSRTLTDAINATKDAVSTQWMNIIESLIGNADQATEVWSEFGEVLYGIFAEPMGDTTAMVEEAFLSNWDILSQKLVGAGISVEKFCNDVETMARAQGRDIDGLIEEYGSLENAVRYGGFEDMIPKIFMGYYQNAIKARDGVEDITTAMEKYKVAVKDLIEANEQGQASAMYEKLTKAGYDLDLVDKLVAKEIQGLTITVDDFSDSIFSNVQFTEEEIKALGDLATEANTTGSALNSAINNLDEIGTRELFIDSFRNALDSLTVVLDTIKEAWNDIFPEWSVQSIRDVVVKLHDLTNRLKPTERQLANIKSVARGVFAVFDMGKQILSSLIQNGFNVLSKILGYFGIDVGTAAGSLGDMLYQMDMFLRDGDKINVFITGVVNSIGTLIVYVKSLISSFMEMPVVKNIITAVSETLGGFKKIFGDFITNLKNLDEFTFENFIAELQKLGENLWDFLFGLDTNTDSKFSNIGNKIKTGFLYIVGLITGGIDGLKNAWKNFWPAFMDTINQINPLSVILITTGLIVLLFTNNIAKATNSLLKTLRPISTAVKGFIDSMSGVMMVLKTGIKSFFKAATFNQITKGIFQLAVSVAALAGSFYLLSIIKYDNIDQVKTLFAALIISVAILANIVRKNRVMLKQLASLFIGISTAVVMLAAAMMLLNDVKLSSFIGGLVILAALFGTVIGLSALAKKFSVHMARGSLFIIAFAAAIGILAVSMQALNKVDSKGLLAKAAAISLLTVVLGVMASLSGKFAGIGTLASGVGLLGFVIALKIIIAHLNDLAEFDYSIILNHIKELGICFAALMVLAIVAGKAGKVLGGAALLIFSITMSIIVLQEVIKSLGKTPANEIFKGTAAITALMFVMGLVVSLSEFAGEHAVKAGGMLLMMSVAIGGLALIIWGLGMLDAKTVIKGTAAISALFMMFSLVLYASKFASNSYKTVYAMTVLLGTLLVAIGFFVSFVKDVNDAIKVAGMLSVLMLALAASFAIMNNVDTLKKGVLKDILLMTLAAGIIGALVTASSAIPGARVDLAIISLSAAALLIAEVAAISKLLKGNLYITDKKLTQLFLMEAMTVAVAAAINGITALFSDNNPELVIANFAGAIMGLLAVSKAMNMLQGVSALDWKVIGQITILGAVATSLGLLVAYFSTWVPEANFGTMIAMVTAAGILMVTLGVVILITSEIKYESIGTAVGIAFAAIFFAGAIALLMASLNLLPTDEIPQLTEKITNIATLILIIGGLSAILAEFGIGAGSIISAGVGIAGAIFVIGIAISALGALIDLFNEKIAKKNGFDISNGLMVLGQSIGGFIGGILSGIDAGLASSLPFIGECLASFTEKAQPFFDSMENLDSDIFANLGEFLLALSAFQLESLLNIFVGEISWTALGEGLAEFGNAIVKFAKSLQELPDDGEALVERGIGIASTLMAFLRSSPRFGGLVNAIIGNLSWVNLGEGLEDFASAMVAFADKTKDFNSNKIKQVELACDAGRYLAALLEDCPRMGGWFQSTFGQLSWASITDGLAGDNGFGKALELFSEHAVKIGPREEDIAAAARAAKSLIEVLQSIDWKKSNTKHNYSNIGDGLPEFGEQMAKFSENVANIPNDVALRVQLIADVALTLSEALDIASKSKKGYKKLSKDLTDFAKELTKAAKASKNMDDKPFLSMKNSVEAVYSIASIKDEKWWKTLEDIGKSVLTYAKRLKEASSKMESVNLTKLKESLELGQTKVEIHGNDDYEDVKITDPAELARINKLQESLWEDEGENVVNGFVKGIDNNVDNVRPAARRIVDTTTNEFNEGFETNSPSKVMAEIGGYVVGGLVQGIEDGDTLVSHSAIKMASNLLNSFKDFLGIHSPSKSFIDAVKWCIEGIKDGSNEGLERIKEVGKKWGTTLLDSVGLNDIANLVNGDYSNLTELITGNLSNAGFDIESITQAVGGLNGELSSLDFSTITSGLSAVSGIAEETQSAVLTKAKKDYDILLEQYKEGYITREKYDKEYLNLLERYTSKQDEEYKAQMDSYNKQIAVLKGNVEYYQKIVDDAEEDKSSDIYQLANERLREQENQLESTTDAMKKYQQTTIKNNVALQMASYSNEELTKIYLDWANKIVSTYEDTMSSIKEQRDRIMDDWAKDSYDDIFKFTTNQDVYDEKVGNYEKQLTRLNWQMDQAKIKYGENSVQVQNYTTQIERLEKELDSYKSWYEYEGFEADEIVGIEFDFDKIEKSTADAKKFTEDMAKLQADKRVSQEYIDYIMSKDYETARALMDWTLYTAKDSEIKRASKDIQENKKAYEQLGLSTWEDAIVEAGDKFNTSMQDLNNTMPETANGVMKNVCEQMANTFSEETNALLGEYGYSGYSIMTSMKEGLGFPVEVDTNEKAVAAGTQTVDDLANSLISRLPVAVEAGATVGEAVADSVMSSFEERLNAAEAAEEFLKEFVVNGKLISSSILIPQWVSEGMSGYDAAMKYNALQRQWLNSDTYKTLQAKETYMDYVDYRTNKWASSPISASYTKELAAVAANEEKEKTTQNVIIDDPTGRGKIINFTVNNNSPHALTQREIDQRNREAATVANTL